MISIEAAETVQEACRRANQPINSAWSSYVRENFQFRETPTAEQATRSTQAWLRWYNVSHRAFPQKQDLVLGKFRIPFIPKYIGNNSR